MPTAAGNGSPSLGEVARRLDKLEESEVRHYEDLVRRIDTLAFVHPETLAMQLQLDQAHRDDVLRQVADVRGEITQIKDNYRWLWRTVLGAILTAIVLAVLVYAGISPR